ncbi:hypothetical protein [Xanthomonas bundabergensis]|uniref:hypothetical protein n=1 Tax=Xanthomonas bundabergensis TaxID=3160842 RepID=UPI003511261F
MAAVASTFAVVDALSHSLALDLAPVTIADVGHAAVFLMTNPYVPGIVLEDSGGALLVNWQF